MKAFDPTATLPGHGQLVARLLPPSSLALPVLAFAYPLKLVSSSTAASKCLTVFMLTYGGGLVSNDEISLDVRVEPAAKLCLLTQGSTKVFKRRVSTHVAKQNLHVTLDSGASLLLLPDPLQPFRDSAYAQQQTVVLPADDSASVVVLDWVSEGRSAQGEHWAMHAFSTRNEFFLPRTPPPAPAVPVPAPADTGASNAPSPPPPPSLPPLRLMLRDAMYLDSPGDGPEAKGKPPLRARMDGMTVFATLVVHGPAFAGLEAHILARYSAEPRIGGRRFDTDEEDRKRFGRFAGIVWTATRTPRGFVLLKAGGRVLEDVRAFLRDVLLEGKEGGAEGMPGMEEGDVVRGFGEGALLCLQ